jgi:hypothetical protein
MIRRLSILAPQAYSCQKATSSEKWIVVQTSFEVVDSFGFTVF